MTVDGESYTETTKFAGKVALTEVLADAKTPAVGVAPTGTHKVVVSAVVTFDGENNDAYTLTGTSNTLYW